MSGNFPNSHFIGVSHCRVGRDIVQLCQRFFSQFHAIGSVRVLWHGIFHLKRLHSVDKAINFSSPNLINNLQSSRMAGEDWGNIVDIICKNKVLISIEFQILLRFDQSDLVFLLLWWVSNIIFLLSLEKSKQDKTTMRNSINDDHHHHQLILRTHI